MKKIAGIFLLLVSAINCTNNTEPAFTVVGDTAVTKNVIVNVELIKDNGTTIATAYFNGKSYNIDNRGVVRYIIYVSYKNTLFYRTEADNLHGQVKGAPINEILITKKDGAVFALYRPLEESPAVGGSALQPSTIFFAKLPDQATAKQKFTALYKTK